MAKTKNKTEYLPLKFCKSVLADATKMYGSNVVNQLADDKEVELVLQTSDEGFQDVKQGIIDFGRGITGVNINPVLEKLTEIIYDKTKTDDDAISFIKDCKEIITLHKWCKNKQCFKFDVDFLDELIKAESVPFSQDSWNYLPFDTFYIDIDGSSLSEYLQGVKGMFINIQLMQETDMTEYHNPQIYKHGGYKSVIVMIREKQPIFLEVTTPNNTVDDVISAYNNKLTTKQNLNDEEIKLSERIKQFLIVDIPQILNYLCSVEPDIQDSDMTKNTYRKPVPNTRPQNRFAEVKINDVGKRFGVTYRAWKKSSSEHKEYTPSDKTRKPVRPHSRRAHWSHFWYKNDDGSKTRRPKWLMQTFVGGTVQPENEEVIVYKVK